MYKIGDRIVYPMHGAGVIVSIEDKELFGEIAQYYSVNIVSEEMEILVPVDKEETCRIRPVGEQKDIDAMLATLTEPYDEDCANWNKRYQQNLEKLKTGNLNTVAGVVRNLTLMDRSKGLSSGEKRMLFSARNFLISEMMMVTGMTKAEADHLIESSIVG